MINTITSRGYNVIKRMWRKRMLKLAMLLSGLMLGACPKPMTNEEIIKQVNICRDGGMNYRMLGWGRTDLVECIP
jgi:hypothetical protein